MAEFEGTPTGAGRRFVVVASRFNETVTQPLVNGALDCLVRHGARSDDIDVVWVPGAWELPHAVARVLQSERYEAVVVCGAVIRGETVAPMDKTFKLEQLLMPGVIEHLVDSSVWQATPACARGRPRDLTQLRKSRTWNVAG